MEKAKIAKYIVIGLIVLLVIVLIFIISNKRELPVNNPNQQNTASSTQKGKSIGIASNKLERGSLILFSTEKTYDGNLGGRQGADKICQSETPSTLRCSNIHAFISVKSGDTIKEMPKVYRYKVDKAIYWYNRSSNNFLLAANNWQDLLDGSIISSPNEGTGARVNYWVGANPDGSLNSKNCRNWTSDGPTLSGAEGRGVVKDSRWLGKGSLSCEGKDNLLCICHK